MAEQFSTCSKSSLACAGHGVMPLQPDAVTHFDSVLVQYAHIIGGKEPCSSIPPDQWYVEFPPKGLGCFKQISLKSIVPAKIFAGWLQEFGFDYPLVGKPPRLDGAFFSVFELQHLQPRNGDPDGGMIKITCIPVVPKGALL